MRNICIAFAMWLAALTGATAAEKVPVCVYFTTSDQVGTTFAFTIREQITASQTYTIVPKCEDAMFVIRMVTTEDEPRVSTAASVTLAIENPKSYDWLITQWSVVVGRERLTTSATNLIAAIDKEAQAVIKALGQ
jgi:hypothetical protein